MKTDVFSLKTENPEQTITVTYYTPEPRTSPWTIVIFPGGAYVDHAQHEGKGYAEFLSVNGIGALVVNYRTSPNRFPSELADARRAVRFLRKHAKELGVTQDKIAVMGSSAGGHLAALVSNYEGPLSCEPIDELDQEDYRPNAQILCYPVISVCPGFGHIGSGMNLLGESYEEKKEEFSLQNMVTEATPPAFIWHTFEDVGVPVINSLVYARALKEHGVSTELHVFPHGRHGLGLANQDPHDTKLCHTAQWSGLLLNWLKLSH